MSSNKKIKIRDLSSKGEGVGVSDDKVIFVNGALPDETVLATITVEKKNIAFADLAEVVTPSKHRVKPDCPYFDKCGGCQIMHLSYNEQLKIKANRVKQAFKKVACMDVEVQECVPSEKEFHYRNKIQLPIALDKSLGLYAKGSHDIVGINRCLVHMKQGDEVYSKISKIIKKSDITPYDESTGTGCLRHLLIRSSSKGGVLIALICSHKPTRAVRDLARTIYDSAPHIEGVVHILNKRKDNVVIGNSSTILFGANRLKETLCGLDFNLSVTSFFQINPFQAQILYQKALEISGVTDEDVVLDAYCGVGTLALIFAKHAKKVVGIEIVESAIEDAKINALINKITNAEFLLGSSEKLTSKLEKIDVAIVNPPRKGCDEIVLKALAKKKPKSIIYISCHPESLARDAKVLKALGYTPEGVYPFDMYPQTMHVETLVKFS